MSDFDPTPYQRIPQLSVRKTIALAVRLLAEIPGDLSDDERKAAKRVRADLSALKAAYALKNSQPPPKMPDKKGADQAVDTAWAALHGRILACSYLPPERYPQSLRARELLTRFFARGLSFLTLEYEAEWAESESKLQSIHDGKLAPLIEEIAGPEYLVEVRLTHDLYGKALGMTPGTASAQKPTEIAVAPLRDALRKSLAAYVRKLVATVDDDDQGSIDRVVLALAPIVDARTKAASGKDESDEDDNDDNDEDSKKPDGA
jgi:hypothetical protein